jgi:hypothetical protein
MKKFEYKLLTVNTSHLRRKNFQTELDEKFRNWGNLGWDLIKMEPITSGGFFYHGASTVKFLIVFKREKINE